jgi:hypothetical protein
MATLLDGLDRVGCHLQASQSKDIPI